MARQISEIYSLPFHQLIGAPVLALVQAQAQASQATAEFIERIGFHGYEGDDKETGNLNPGELGRMRMVTFKYQKQDVDGVNTTFNAEVPLLSLVPIPAVEIKEADFELNVKVTDIQVGNTATTLAAKNPDEGDWLSPKRVEFRTSMGRMESVSSSSRSSEFQMKVKMRVEQADIPAGMSRLFNIMDQSMSSSSEKLGK